MDGDNLIVTITSSGTSPDDINKIISSQKFYKVDEDGKLVEYEPVKEYILEPMPLPQYSPGDEYSDEGGYPAFQPLKKYEDFDGNVYDMGLVKELMDLAKRDKWQRKAKELPPGTQLEFWWADEDESN